MKVSSNNEPSCLSIAPSGRREKLVYILLAPKPQKYPRGRSRIMYVGTTEKGISRIAGSVSNKI